MAKLDKTQPDQLQIDHDDVMRFKTTSFDDVIIIIMPGPGNLIFDLMIFRSTISDWLQFLIGSMFTNSRLHSLAVVLVLLSKIVCPSWNWIGTCIESTVWWRSIHSLVDFWRRFLVVSFEFHYVFISYVYDLDDVGDESLRDLGYQVDFVMQCGLGGPQSEAFLNFDSLIGFDKDVNGHDRIITKVQAVMYLAADDFGCRRRANVYPAGAAEAMRNGEFEAYLKRHDYIISNQLVTNFGTNQTQLLLKQSQVVRTHVPAEIELTTATMI